MSSLATIPVPEQHLYQTVNTFARNTGWLHPPMVAYAQYGVVLFGLLLVIGWWAARGRRDPRAMAASLWAGGGMLIAVWLNQFIVHAVDRPRPFTVLPGAFTLLAHSPDPGFPSDHAVMAGGVLVGLFIYHRLLGVIALVAGLLIAFARVYVGVHWPGDVAFGLIYGGAVVGLGWLVVRGLLTALVVRLTETPLRPLLAAR